MSSEMSAQNVIAKVNEFRHLEASDSNDKVKAAIREILQLWPLLLAEVDKASDDELFTLNVSRAALSHVFAVAFSGDLFGNDRSFAREIYLGYFELLTHHADVFTLEEFTPASTCISSNVRLMMTMASSITSMASFMDNDLNNKESVRLLTMMREHVDRDRRHDELTEGIISLIWNLADRTFLVPVLLKAGYAQSVVEWIRARQTKFRIGKNDAPIHILHNLSRHDDGIDQLNACGALEVLKQLQNDPYTDDDLDMQLHVTMSRALLTTADRIRTESMMCSKKILDMLLQLTIDAAKNARYRQSGSHVSEPLVVLYKLFFHDETLNYILDEVETKPASTARSTLELFTSLFVKFYPTLSGNDRLESFTCVALVNILSLVSNHEQYRQILRDQAEFMQTIKSVANDDGDIYIDIFMPRSMKSVKRATSEIVDNVDGSILL